MKFEDIKKEAQENMIDQYAKIFDLEIENPQVLKKVIEHLKKYKVVNEDGSFPLPKQPY